MSCISNKPSVEDRSKINFLVFREGNIEIIKGVETEAKINLSNFFIETSNYISQKFQVKSKETLLIKSGNIGNIKGEIRFIAIYVKYPDDTIEDNKYLHWQYPYLKLSENNSPEIEEDKMNLGEIMILSGSTLESKGWDLSSDDGSPIFGGISIINPHESIDVDLEILIVE